MQHIVVAESCDVHPVKAKSFVSGCVALRIVSRAVDLNRQANRGTVKVDDVTGNDVLTAKEKVFDLPLLQR